MSLNLQHAGLLPGNKVAHLIEHLVIGQGLFVILSHDLAAVDHTGTVVQTPLRLPGVTNNHPQGWWQLVAQALQQSVDLGGQTGPEQQILGWIAGQCQFREHHHTVWLPGTGFFADGDDALAVARQVADKGVDLCHTDFHRQTPPC